MGHIQRRPWRRHGNNGDTCIVLLGEGKPVLKSFGRQFGAVGSNQDMLVHWSTSTAPATTHHARGVIPWQLGQLRSCTSTSAISERYQSGRPTTPTGTAKIPIAARSAPARPRL